MGCHEYGVFSEQDADKTSQDLARFRKMPRRFMHMPLGIFEVRDCERCDCLWAGCLGFQANLQDGIENLRYAKRLISTPCLAASPANMIRSDAYGSWVG